MIIKFVKRYSFQYYTNFQLQFPTFSTDYQIDCNIQNMTITQIIYRIISIITSENY